MSSLGQDPPFDTDDIQVGTRSGSFIQGTKGCYQVTRVIGNGSFGVVYKAIVLTDHSVVAIKMVPQDDRFKNRELEIMNQLDHKNIVQLIDAFTGVFGDRFYLYLVMEYVPETIHNVVVSNHSQSGEIPLIYVKLYIYQLCRALNYIHSKQICHRDIKPQNILVNQQDGILSLCDFGSAKPLKNGETSAHYICSRYYRAPELIFGSSTYSTSIDIWSVGCVLAEMILGEPLFAGEDQVDQLVHIIHVLGTPTKEDITSMNGDFSDMNFHLIEPEPFHHIFGDDLPLLCDLLSHMLVYKPEERITPLNACAHPFFDELRDEETRLPNGEPLPMLFDFSVEELGTIDVDTFKKLIPLEYQKTYPDDMFTESSENNDEE